MLLDETHVPTARAWLASAHQGGDFPLQNLPYGACRRKGSAGSFWVGVAIGDSALNLGALSQLPVWGTLGPDLDAAAFWRDVVAARQPAVVVGPPPDVVAWPTAATLGVDPLRRLAVRGCVLEGGRVGLAASWGGCAWRVLRVLPSLA